MNQTAKSILVTRREKDDGVFRWRAKSLWRAAIREMFSDVITKEVFADMYANPPEAFFSDDLSWLEDAIQRNTGFNEDLFHAFENRFPVRFPFIRVFHGCRPLDWSTFRQNGLCLKEIKRQKDVVVEVFGDSDALRQAIADLEKKYIKSDSNFADLSGGEIWFCLDRREAVRGSSHYIKYGSEYLLSLAARLHAEPVLTARGIPTLLHCNISYFSMRSKIRQELMGALFEDLFSHYFGQPFQDYNGLNFAFPVYESVPPNQIIRLEHVRNVGTRR